MDVRGFVRGTGEFGCYGYMAIWLLSNTRIIGLNSRKQRRIFRFIDTHPSSYRGVVAHLVLGVVVLIARLLA